MIRHIFNSDNVTVFCYMQNGMFFKRFKTIIFFWLHARSYFDGVNLVLRCDVLSVEL